MDRKDPKLAALWRQDAVPVIYRPGSTDQLMVRLPFADDNRTWLRAKHHAQPVWHDGHKCWRVPRSWFDDVVKRSIVRHGAAYVIQPFHVSKKCAPACWDAKGAECDCSCLGANHGSGKPDGRWHEVSETCAVSWGPKQYSCRLLRPVPVLF
jgi:hypothetical protein